MKLGALTAAAIALAACGAQPAAQQSPATSPSPVLAVSPSPAASPSPAPSPSAPFQGAVGLSGCPTPAADQHPLGSPGAPGAGVHSDPTLKWSGCGTASVPPGTARFITGNSWQLGFATSCPNGLDYGAGGMGTSVKFKEVLVTGAAGPDEMDAAGPWTDGGGGLMAHGGNYQIQVTAIDPRCLWSVAVYPSS